MIWTFFNILLALTLFIGMYLSSLFLLTYFSNEGENKNTKSKNKRYSLSIIVPAYNESETIKETITSLLKLKYPKNKIEIIVVDDGSTDNTYELAKEFEKKYKRVRVFRKKNGGKGSALNYGIKRARGEIIATMDADSFVKEDAIEKMIPLFEDEKVMAVTASLKVYKPRNILERVQHAEYLLGVFLRKTFSILNSLYITPGPFTLYRKRFFEENGLFREDVITEDMEMGMRIKSQGYTIENVIDAEVYTVAPSKFNALLKQRIRWYLGGVELAFKEYRYMFFNPSYSVMGMIIFPSAYITTFLALFLFIYGVASKLHLLYLHVHDLYLINFDILTLIKSYSPSFSIYISPLYVISFFSIVIGLSMIWIGKRHSKDKEMRLYMLLYYYLVYWALFSLWWFTVVYHKITGREIRFGNLVWKKGKTYKEKITE